MEVAPTSGECYSYADITGIPPAWNLAAFFIKYTFANATVVSIDAVCPDDACTGCGSPGIQATADICHQNPQQPGPDYKVPAAAFANAQAGSSMKRQTGSKVTGHPVHKKRTSAIDDAVNELLATQKASSRRRKHSSTTDEASSRRRKQTSTIDEVLNTMEVKKEMERALKAAHTSADVVAREAKVAQEEAKNAQAAQMQLRWLEAHSKGARRNEESEKVPSAAERRSAPGVDLAGTLRDAAAATRKALAATDRGFEALSKS
jgi:hypothetical protein